MPVRARDGTRARAADLEGLAARSLDVLYRYRLWPTPALDYISEATRRLGWEPEELYADPDAMLTVVHPEDRCLVEERLALGPTRDAVVLRWRRKDGSTVWMEHRETPIYDRSGTLLAIEGIARELPDPTRGADATVRILDGLRLDLANQVVRVDGERLRLSPAEFRLLALLTAHPGHVFTRRELTRRLWESPHTGSGHACESCISTLRRKIERDPRLPERIVTVRGRGYMYVVSERD